MKPYVFEFVCVCVCVFCVCDVNIFKFSFVLDFVWFMFLIDPLENNLGVATTFISIFFFCGFPNQTKKLPMNHGQMDGVWSNWSSHVRTRFKHNSQISKSNVSLHNKDSKHSWSRCV